MLKTILEMLKGLLQCETVIDRIQGKMEKLMADAQTFKGLVTGIGTETDRLAAKVAELIEQVKGGSLTGPEEQELLEGLQAIHDRLSVIGTDPNNPIPPVDPNDPANFKK